MYVCVFKNYHFASHPPQKQKVGNPCVINHTPSEREREKKKPYVDKIKISKKI